VNDADTSLSALEAAAASAGADAVRAFGTIGSEIRLAILLALWEAYDPYATDNAIPFSELRKRLDVSDPGRFNYHLGKLREGFVKKTDDGYELRPAGLHLVQTVLAGAGMQQAAVPPTVVDAECLRCGAPTAVSYRNGWLYYCCTECEGFFEGGADQPTGIHFSQALPPAGLSNRSVEDVFATAVLRMILGFATKMGGVCPRCSGVVDSTFEICDSHHTTTDTVCSNCHREYDVAVRWACTVCKYRGQAPPSVAAIVHPTVVAFYHDHGIAVGYTVDDFETSRRLLSLLGDHEQELRSVDPPRVLVTVRYAGDELRLTFDEAMHVVEEHG
jgi:hypothetical protein